MPQRHIYPGRSPDQMRTSNARWFKLDMAPEYEEDEHHVMAGSSIDAPLFIASGSTTMRQDSYAHIMVREIRREQ